MSVEAIRIPVLRFFTEIQETFTRIVFGAEPESAPLPAAIQQIYVESYIPEGFSLDFAWVDPSMAILSYTIEADYFDWNQYRSDDAVHVDMRALS